MNSDPEYKRDWIRSPALGLLTGFLGLMAPIAHAEIPSLDSLFPAGGRQGTLIPVIATGSLQPWPVKVWSDDPGLIFKPEESNGRFQVELSRNVAPGPHLIRVYTADGASAPRCFVVGQWAEQTEPETAERADRGEVVAELPVTLNGRLRQRGETDSYVLQLETGQTLHAAVTAYRLDSAPIMALVLVYPDGAKAVGNPVTRSVDPQLFFPITQTGSCRLLVAADSTKGESRWAGLEAGVYRLSLRSERPVSAPVAGPSADDLAGGTILRPFQSAQQLKMPGVAHGQISYPGKEARYVLAARQGEKLFFQVQSGSLGSPLAVVLKVLDGTGYPVAQASPAQDPQLTFTAPSDGVYTLVIADALSRGGPEYRYQLELGAPVPHFTATLDTHGFRVAAGQTVAIALTVTRPPYFQGPVHIVPIDLPAGVTAGPAQVPPAGGSVELRLDAAPDAQPANQPFRIVVLAPGLPVPMVAIAQARLRGRYAAPGDLLINETDRIWLTVLAK